MFTRDRAPAAILALILLVAFGLRVWSLGHGLPYSYNLDERAHFVPHAVSMTTGDLNPGYFVAAGEPKELWRIPEGGHTGGIDARSGEYERRVIGFFDRALLGESRTAP